MPLLPAEDVAAILALTGWSLPGMSLETPNQITSDAAEIVYLLSLMSWAKVLINIDDWRLYVTQSGEAAALSQNDGNIELKHLANLQEVIELILMMDGVFTAGAIAGDGSIQPVTLNSPADLKAILQG